MQRPYGRCGSRASGIRPILARLLDAHQTVLDGEQARLGAVGGADLRVDVLDVAACGLAGDHELLGDLLVRQSAHKEPEDLDLAAREAFGSLATAPDGMAGGPEHGLDRV